MSSEAIVPYRVYTPAEAADLLRLPVAVVFAAIRQGDLAARTAGGEARILGQALLDYLMGVRAGLISSSDLDTSRPPSRDYLIGFSSEKARNVYDIATVRGGKDDGPIQAALEGKLEAIRCGKEVTLQPSSMDRPHWNGAVSVEIRDDVIVFPEGKDHANIPVAIKAAIRVLHRNGLRGRLRVQAWDTHLTIGPPSR